MKINIKKEMFTAREYEFLNYGNIKISAFSYQTGVEALKVATGRAEFVFLPFLGQQIWDFYYDGRKISMQTSVKEPKRATEYLFNYGGFLYHCGITAFGSPQKEDVHPQHGELPNAEYSDPYILLGEDESGKYAVFGGRYVYDKAFIRSYAFSPELKVYENSGLLRYKTKLENLKGSPMEYMYLCHINFMPIVGAKLVYSANRNSERIKIHGDVQSVREELAKPLSDYIKRLEKDISIADTVLGENQAYNPELCFTVKYESDENGFAYTMQREKGKGACYVRHNVDELPYVIRWISSTPDESALGMALPATSEHFGYSYAKRNGQVKILPPYGVTEFNIVCGYIDEEFAEIVENKIQKIILTD